MTHTPIAAPRAGASHPTVYFIRHGETEWNRDGRLQGQRDIPLNALGRRQAATVAGHLRDTIGDKVGTLPWLVSPMDRVRETCAIVRQTLGLPADGVTYEPRLIELSFGRWEGMTWKEVRKADPAGAAIRKQDKWGCLAPDGESYQLLLERVRPVLDEMTGETVVVAHGGVARTFLVALCGMDTHEASEVDIWQGRLMVIKGGGAYWVP